MMINKDSLKAKTKQIAQKLGITQNIVYNRFFFDAFLSRLSLSTYKDKFVLKGGLYLSSVLGIDNRSTMDIDFYVRQLSLQKEKMMLIVEEIAAMDIGDGIQFEVVGSSPIRLERAYGGIRIKLLARMENLRYKFAIDVARGDPLVLKERSYDYKCLVNGEILPLQVYGLESVIAEKLEATLSKGDTNSRCKDFYDLYILRKTQLENINLKYLKQAFIDTCQNRNLSPNKKDVLSLIDHLAHNNIIHTRWESYTKKAKYAQGLEFADVLLAIREWIEDIL